MRISLIVLGLLLDISCLTRVHAQAAQPDGAHIRPGTLPITWNTGGPKCMEMPEWQLHEYNPDLYILRQSGCTDYEKPFVFLLFGSDRVLLLDTGSRRGNLAPQIQLTVHRWLLRNHRASIPLIVVHTHSHSDHVAGDAELQALDDPNIPVTYVAPTVEANQKFYGIAHWPEDSGAVDLGNRIIDVLAIPGHDAAAVALYDRQTAILFTGDSVYPGRLYIRDLSAFENSNRRMLRFTEGRLVAISSATTSNKRVPPTSTIPWGPCTSPTNMSGLCLAASYSRFRQAWRTCTASRGASRTVISRCGRRALWSRTATRTGRRSSRPRNDNSITCGTKLSPELRLLRRSAPRFDPHA
jgi:hydroxyacylglutathione hydrolase